MVIRIFHRPVAEHGADVSYGVVSYGVRRYYVASRKPEILAGSSKAPPEVFAPRPTCPAMRPTGSDSHRLAGTRARDRARDRARAEEPAKAADRRRPLPLPPSTVRRPHGRQAILRSARQSCLVKVHSPARFRQTPQGAPPCSAPAVVGEVRQVNDARSEYDPGHLADLDRRLRGH
jgi:hypothetical protein